MGPAMRLAQRLADSPRRRQGLAGVDKSQRNKMNRAVDWSSTSIRLLIGAFVCNSVLTTWYVNNALMMDDGHGLGHLTVGVLFFIPLVFYWIACTSPLVQDRQSGGQEPSSSLDFWWAPSSTLACPVFWSIYQYSRGSGFPDNVSAVVWELLAFVVAVVYMALTVRLTKHLMATESGARSGTFADRLRAHPFESVSLFLGIFLNITVLLGLSLALHDLRLGNAALYVDVPSQIPWYSEEPDVPPPPPPGGVPLGNIPCSGKKSLGCEHIVLFQDSSAAVEADTNEHPRSVPPHVVKNKDALPKIIEKLSELGSDRRVSGVLVSLIGTTSETPVNLDSTKFTSNYELSAVRIGNVYKELMSRLDASVFADVRWRLMPLSHDPLRPQDEQRSVEVKIVAVQVPANLTEMNQSITTLSDAVGTLQSREWTDGRNQLRLLDYLYFMIYTTTTTGNGDIKPVTPFAKMLSSVANIFEVLFLVIFLNVLLTGKLPPPTPPPKELPGPVSGD